jgi:serine/threonine protein kinase
MTLSNGTRLSHYEITSQIGKGGMGEVYQAKDTKLGREVAIKVLPEEFAKDADRVARFQREAKLLAFLNHPNIAAIYGLEESDGTNFLVMELVEGDTLDTRIKSGAIPVEEALKLALQITEALEAAHDKGVIHRDLKPANIKVTPDGKVKVLDFGLAKAFAGEQADLNLSNSPTLSDMATQQGIILGTAAYMSPEQARGKEVDKRADIWSFGVILYEMFTGENIFAGEDVSSTLARVLERQPDFSTLFPSLHPKITEVLKRCLQKELPKRYHDIADTRLDLQEISEDPRGMLSQPSTREKAQLSRITSAKWGLLTAVLVIIAGIVVWVLKPTQSHKTAQVVRVIDNLPVNLIKGAGSYPILAVSPDGREFVYGTSDGLYLRSIDNYEVKIIPGTKGESLSPFFSSDGDWVGYYSPKEKKLKKIQIRGGLPTDLCELDGIPVMPSWGADENILYGDRGKGVMRISAGDGSPTLLIKAEQGFIHSPQMLPDGKTVLYCLNGTVLVKNLEVEKPKELFRGTTARYLPTGHILYSSENILYVVPFDLDKLEITGGAKDDPVFEGVSQILTGAAQYAVSDSGTIIYVPASDIPNRSELVWVYMNGDVKPIGTPPDEYQGTSISPDGKKIAFTISEGETSDLYVYDLLNDKRLRLTVGKKCTSPIWALNGERIIFLYSDQNLNNEVLSWVVADGRGEIVEVTSVPGLTLFPQSWSRDGKNVIVMESPGFGRLDIGMVSIEDPYEHQPLIYEDYREHGPKVSPDGQWIAYVSLELGRPEVCVSPFPNVDQNKWQVSEGGGTDPLWSDDSRKLFYRRFNDAIMSVLVQIEPGFNTEKPKFLFDDTYLGGIPANGNSWDIHPDGQRFLMKKSVISEDNESRLFTPQVNIVVNWFEELKKKVPVP